MAYPTVAPFVPLQAHIKGIPTQQVGIILGMYSIPFLIVPPIIGNLMDKIGRRNIFFLGTIILSLSLLLYSFLARITSNKSFILLAIFSRLLQGIGSSCIMTSTFAIVSVVYPHLRTKMITLVQSFDAFGLMIGPMISSFLFSVGGYYLPFLVMSICLLISGVFTRILLNNKCDTNDDSFEHQMSQPLLKRQDTGQLINKNLKLNYCTLVNRKLFLLIFLGGIINVIQLSFFQSILARRFSEMQIYGSSVGYYYSIITIFFAIACILLLLVPQKQPKFKLLILGNVVCGIGIFMFGPSKLLQLPNLIEIMCVGMGLIGFSNSVAYSFTLPQMINSVKYEFPTRANKLSDISSAFYNIGVGFANLISPLMGSTIDLLYGFKVTCDSMAIITLVYALVLSLFICLGKRRIIQQTTQVVQDVKKINQKVIFLED